jgi:anti-anti-sigma regulatory factor
MLRITRTENGGVVFKLSGRIEGENIAELKALLSAETNGRRLLLDLSDLTLVDQDVISFLRHCESDGIELKNCPPYIRAWITQEADQA